ncbi:MAG: putative zinc-binding protein [Lentisphaerota bacterium]
MMSGKNTCACATAPKLIFACSGAADVGAIADQAARKLSREGKGKTPVTDDNIALVAEKCAAMLEQKGCCS